MIKCCAILLLMIAGLVVLPTGAVRACCEAENGQKTEVVQEGDSHYTTFANHCADDIPCNDCPPDTDGCGHYHCPGCGAAGYSPVGFFKNTFQEIPSAPDWLHAGRSVNFFYRMPSTSGHLTTLFQPPRN